MCISKLNRSKQADELCASGRLLVPFHLLYQQHLRRVYQFRRGYGALESVLSIDPIHNNIINYNAYIYMKTKKKNVFIDICAKISK